MAAVFAVVIVAVLTFAYSMDRRAHRRGSTIVGGKEISRRFLNIHRAAQNRQYFHGNLGDENSQDRNW